MNQTLIAAEAFAFSKVRPPLPKHAKNSVNTALPALGESRPPGKTPITQQQVARAQMFPELLQLFNCKI